MLNSQKRLSDQLQSIVIKEVDPGCPQLVTLVCIEAYALYMHKEWTHVASTWKDMKKNGGRLGWSDSLECNSVKF